MSGGRARVASGSRIGYGCFMKLMRRNWSERNYEALNGLLAGVRPGEIAVLDWDNTCIFGDIGEALLRRLTFDLAFAVDAETMAATVPDVIHGIGHILIQGKPFSLKKNQSTCLRRL